MKAFNVPASTGQKLPENGNRRKTYLNITKALYMTNPIVKHYPTW